jgi:ketosteroid isomerase-like protein
MNQDDDLAQLQTLEKRVAAAFNNKDVDALMSAYASGESLFVFDVVGPPGVHVGWDAYRDAFQKMFAAISGPLKFTMSDLDIQVSGDIAFGHSLQRISGVHAMDGKHFDYTVRVTDVYRSMGGKWLIVHEHVSLALDRQTFTPILHPTLASR